MLGWQRNLSFFAVHVSLPCLVHPALLENQSVLGLHDAFSAQEKPLGLPNGSDVPWLGMKLKGYFWMIMCCLSLNSDHSRYGVQVLTAGSS